MDKETGELSVIFQQLMSEMKVSLLKICLKRNNYKYLHSNFLTKITLKLLQNIFIRILNDFIKLKFSANALFN